MIPVRAKRLEFVVGQIEDLKPRTRRRKIERMGATHYERERLIAGICLLAAVIVAVAIGFIR